MLLKIIYLIYNFIYRSILFQVLPNSWYCNTLNRTTFLNVSFYSYFEQILHLFSDSLFFGSSENVLLFFNFDPSRNNLFRSPRIFSLKSRKNRIKSPFVSSRTRISRLLLFFFLRGNQIAVGIVSRYSFERGESKTKLFFRLLYLISSQFRWTVSYSKFYNKYFNFL